MWAYQTLSLEKVRGEARLICCDFYGLSTLLGYLKLEHILDCKNNSILRSNVALRILKNNNDFS